MPYSKDRVPAIVINDAVKKSSPAIVWRYRKFSTANGRYTLTIFANWLKNSMLNLGLLYSCFNSEAASACTFGFEYYSDIQFSHLRFGILENSLMLFEIIVRSKLKAWAAISISSGPIVWPLDSSDARISP